MPSTPPSSRSVLTVAEAIPVRAGATRCSTAIDTGVKVRPMPKPSTTSVHRYDQ